MTRQGPPASAVPWRTVAAGTTGVLLSLAWVLIQQPALIVSLVLMLATCALPMWALEYLRFARSEASTVLKAGAPSRFRSLRLEGGLLVFIALALTIQLQLWLAGPAVAGLYVLHFPLLVATAIWALLQATWSARDRDVGSVGQLALSLRGLLRERTWTNADRQCVLGWGVKLFFLPLMLAGLYDWMGLLKAGASPLQGWMSAFLAAMALMYALDTLFGTIGYLSTHRAIGAHIRSTDSTWLGWLSALVCYPPLSLLVLRQWLDYRDGIEWTHWLGDSWLAMIWACAIVLLTGIYTLSTLVFGPRFSNLTNRGIITCGPFRLTKHPAYISKNLSWWLIAVPFISDQGATTAALNCAALLGVNGIYLLRARTEERHLMHDPTYREYAAWIATHGLFARCRHMLRLRTA